jgi:hypothetical protein
MPRIGIDGRDSGSGAGSLIAVSATASGLGGCGSGVKPASAA